MLKFKTPDLIDALEGRREWAEALDARMLADHKAAEKEYLKEFRAACRDAAKWDYETAKNNGFRPMYRSNLSSPSCPRMTVPKLDRWLGVILASRSHTITVSESGAWSEVFWLLTHDENINTKGPC